MSSQRSLIQTSWRLKLIDFGLAKITQSALQTQAGIIMPPFISPEQAAGQNSGARSDVYAFGVTLYLMCCGQLPFTGNAQAMLAPHLSQTARPSHDINPTLSKT
jgi:eukaryotic-like serine/threonine-protein kinase